MARKATPKHTRTKAEPISVRVSPKLKYGLELLARRQHRSLSMVVMWALQQAVDDPAWGLFKLVPTGKTETFPDLDTGEPVELQHLGDPVPMLDMLWHESDPDRLVKLAMNWPELLDYKEQVIWDVIKTYKRYWLEGRTPNLETIRNNWDAILNEAKQKG